MPNSDDSVVKHSWKGLSTDEQKVKDYFFNVDPGLLWKGDSKAGWACSPYEFVVRVGSQLFADSRVRSRGELRNKDNEIVVDFTTNKTNRIDFPEGSMRPSENFNASLQGFAFDFYVNKFEAVLEKWDPAGEGLREIKPWENSDPSSPEARSWASYLRTAVTNHGIVLIKSEDRDIRSHETRMPDLPGDDETLQKSIEQAVISDDESLAGSGGQGSTHDEPGALLEGLEEATKKGYSFEDILDGVQNPVVKKGLELMWSAYHDSAFRYPHDFRQKEMRDTPKVGDIKSFVAKSLGFVDEKGEGTWTPFLKLLKADPGLKAMLQRGEKGKALKKQREERLKPKPSKKEKDVKPADAQDREDELKKLEGEEAQGLPAGEETEEEK
jgi:hypothetical protein